MIIVRDGRIVIIRDGRPTKEALDDGKYYTMKEFAELRGVPYCTVRQWKKRNKINTVNIYGRDYICANVQIRAKKVGRPLKKRV